MKWFERESRHNSAIYIDAMLDSDDVHNQICYNCSLYAQSSDVPSIFRTYIQIITTNVLYSWGNNKKVTLLSRNGFANLRSESTSIFYAPPFNVNEAIKYHETLGAEIAKCVQKLPKGYVFHCFGLRSGY